MKYMFLNRQISYIGKNRQRFIFYLVGCFSLLWFLFRVIPKPSRASYPCMRASFPFASGFVIYILSVSASWYSFHSFRDAVKNQKNALASLLLLLSVYFFINALVFMHDDTFGGNITILSPVGNEPIGKAVGIFPGRVVWVYDHLATRAACTNTVNKNGVLDDGDDVWFQNKNTDVFLVTQMVSRGIQALTGENNDYAAWDAIFQFHNEQRGKGKVGYSEGEKIFIKLNRTSTNISTNLDVNTMYRNDKYGRTALSETSPQMVLAVLRHLVYKAGVSQDAIFIGDFQRNHYQDEYDDYQTEFPDVNYLGTDIYHKNVKIIPNGRKPIGVSNSSKIIYSDNGVDMPNAKSDYLYDVFDNMDYLVNLPMMKGHATGGITLFPKNHFGSQSRESANHLHGGLIHQRTGYGRYRVQVDIMGSEHLGKKNLVYILDALWAGPDWGDDPVKFRMSPFNDHWTSSVFFSLDPVAIESVAFDFLRTEFDGQNQYTNKGYPNMDGCDDYLHQAASESNWPTGIVYKPNVDGVKIGSLGVHEHWNNPIDKKYSRNLVTGQGIELKSQLVENRPPYQIREFEPKLISEKSVPFLIVQDLNAYFIDYENDAITYTVITGSEHISAELTGTQLYLTINGPVAECFTISLKASDGKDSYTTLLPIIYSENVGITSLYLKHSLTLFPNPVTNILNIEVDNDISAGNIKIIDIYGRIMLSRQASLSRHSTFSMDLETLLPGRYFLHISSDQKLHSSTFIKQ